MRKHVLIFLIGLACVVNSPTNAQQPGDIFGTILGEIGRQMEKKQQKKLRKKLKPLWQACSQGDVGACDTAATYPLSSSDRINLQRMRQAASLRPQFERDWYACRNKNDLFACSSALNYPFLTDNDRNTLVRWRRAAQAEIDRRQREQAAIEKRRREQAEIAKRQRRFRELRDAFLDLWRRCMDGGDATACEAAARHQSVRQDERVDIAKKLDSLSTITLGAITTNVTETVDGLPASTLVTGSIAVLLAIVLGFMIYQQRRPGMVRVESEVKSARSTASKPERTTVHKKTEKPSRASREKSNRKISTSESSNGTASSVDLGAALAPVLEAIGHPAVFATAYVIFMLPTYWLPYLGSNSAAVNSASAAASGGLNPAFWVHFGCLAMLAALAWIRGGHVGKRWLIVFPLMAALFDLAPVLNFIPLIPTVMHLLAVIVGVMGVTQSGADGSVKA